MWTYIGLFGVALLAGLLIGYMTGTTRANGIELTHLRHYDPDTDNTD